MTVDQLNKRIYRLTNAARDHQRAQIIQLGAGLMSPENRKILREAETSCAAALFLAQNALREYISETYVPRKDMSLGPLNTHQE